MIVGDGSSTKTLSERVAIRHLQSLRDMLPIVKLQRMIWGYGKPNAGLPYPARALFAISESGGHVAGAFIKSNIVGFSLAWLGTNRFTGENYLHSQLMGVLQSFRHLSIGYQLKLDQKNFAQNRNLDLVKWPFDPLRSANANLNIRKLGAVVRSYKPDYYGQMDSDFNQGLTTDRVWAEWYISSNRVCQRLAGVSIASEQKLTKLPKLTCVLTDENKKSLLKHVDYEPNKKEQQLLVELPDDFQTLVDSQLSLAKEWQAKIRDILQKYFQNGYIITDFLTVSDQQRRSFYLITQDPLHHILEGKRKDIRGN